MKKFISMLIPMILTACATTYQASLPVDGFIIEGVFVGDRVKIVMSDGEKQSMSVTRVDELGLYGSDDSYAYLDMQSVSVIQPRQSKQWLWLFLSLAAVAVFAEPDSGGHGPFCLRSSDGGPCL